MHAHTLKCSVIIEHITAAMEIEEIIFFLRDYIVGINVGRWNFIFSIIKTFRYESMLNLPSRNLITLHSEYMEAFSKRMVHLGHKRGVHVIGGVSNVIPRKQSPEITEAALKVVMAEKSREAA